MALPPPRIWTYFGVPDSFADAQLPSVVKTNHYVVDTTALIQGDAVTDFKPGAEILRLCSNLPLRPDDNSGTLAGCTQHLHYTSEVQRARLLALSAQEIPPPERPIAVLIPIRKSDAWWCLAHEARSDLMNGTLALRGHTAIGEEFAPVIYRQLLHSRYLDSSKKAYDFLTYFEFREKDRDAFKTLLQRLRDCRLNPEWGMVEMEQEIWMRKIA